MREWSIREAKNRLGELIEAATREPQAITHQGEQVVVVLAQKEFDRLTGRIEPLADFFARSGLDEVKLERIEAGPRKVKAR